MLGLGGISDSLSGYFISHLILVTSSYKLGGITDCLFGYFISHLILVTSSEKFRGCIWLRWTLYLQTWPAKMCLNNNTAYYMWQIWGLMIEISVAMSIAMWNCQSWPLDDSSNVKLAFLTTRCQIAIWNCHSWPLDVISSLKLPFLTTRHQ